MNTLDFINHHPDLCDRHREILRGAIATRGKRKGFILENPPSQSKRPQDWVAWQAMVLQVAPVRVSAWSLMLLNDEQRGLFDELDKALDGMHVILSAIEPPMRWNLSEMRFDRETVQAALVSNWNMPA